MIEQYRWRWRIEQRCAMRKQAGLKLKASQLESGEAIQRLAVLVSLAVRTLQRVEGRAD